MTVVVISGTGTGVGKTVAMAAIAAIAHADGQRVALVKPAQTGVAANQPGDLDAAARLSGVRDLHELARYPEALAPGTAARRAGLDGVTPEQVADVVAQVAAERHLVLIEGAGGLLVRFDSAGGTIADVAAALDAPVVVVTPAGLGALNAASLTVEALRARRLTCAGLVIGSWPAYPDLAARCNVDDFGDYTDVPLLAAIPEQAGTLDRERFLQTARQALAPPLGGTWDAATFRAAAREIT